MASTAMEPAGSAIAGVEAVEADLEKVLSKFRSLDEHAQRVLDDSMESVIKLRQELASVPDDYDLTAEQVMIVRETVQRCRETVQRLAGDHRDAHPSVSRIGKSIDRHFVLDYAAVAPRAAQFSSDVNRRLADRAVVQHLCRQGLEDVARVLAEEADIADEVSSGEPFAALQHIAMCLTAGDTGPAMDWVQRHTDELGSSPLLFVLHRFRFLQIAKEQSPLEAVRFARAHFPRHAARHERELQRAMCALTWFVESAVDGPVPTCYATLHDLEGLATAAAELFIKEACALLKLAPLSPLGAAVLAGSRVMPALLDICAKITHPHVAAAWANKDELPLEVTANTDLVEDIGFHHSIFACPILRQQASEANPPMRLLCGHVISKDALHKLVVSTKLKCPYCPMEQSPSKARLIYFS